MRLQLAQDTTLDSSLRADGGIPGDRGEERIVRIRYRGGGQFENDLEVVADRSDFRFSAPYGLAFDPLDADLLYFTEVFGGSRIFKVDLASKVDRVTLVAGSSPGAIGDGDAPLRAKFTNPRGIVVSRSGSIFVADSRNHRVRRFFPFGLEED